MTAATRDMNVVNAQPVAKWAGGKRRIAPLILKALAIDATCHEYVEPFLGGGAIFFALHEVHVRPRPPGVQPSELAFRLSDNNDDLMGMYKTVRDNMAALVAELRNGEYTNDEKTYYDIRQREPVGPVLRAARFLYLNRHCFNGLYRVNGKGKFNVPFGKYENPMLLDEENLCAVSTALAGTKLDAMKFEAATELCTKHSAAYMDPPYVPTSKTANFTGYASGGFREEDQRRLASECVRLVELGARVVASNANVPLVREIYPETHFEVREIQAARAVSCKADGRQKVTELLMVGRRG